MNDQSKRQSALQKFREANRRVDFYPTRDSLTALERLRQSRPHESTRLLLDRLVIAGIKAYFPENGDGNSGNAGFTPEGGQRESMGDVSVSLQHQEKSRSSVT